MAAQRKPPHRPPEAPALPAAPNPLPGRDEIARFAVDGLLWRIYLRADGEILFTVTGDPLRLHLTTMADECWDWDGSCHPLLLRETSLVVHTHTQPLAVLRTVALRLAQYLGRHQPPFFYWRIADDPRRRRLYARLLARHADALRAYRQQVDDTGAYFLFTRTTPEAT